MAGILNRPDAKLSASPETGSLLLVAFESQSWHVLPRPCPLSLSLPALRKNGDRWDVSVLLLPGVGSSSEAVGRPR